VVNLDVCAGPQVIRVGYTEENGQLGALMELAVPFPFFQRGRVMSGISALFAAAMIGNHACLGLDSPHMVDFIHGCVLNPET
jgi:hypothetical protein